MKDEVKANEQLKAELSKKADTNHSLVEQMANLESENAELKAQIEKMKCCGNCRYNSDMEEGIVYQECRDCDGKCNWKLEE